MQVSLQVYIVDCPKEPIIEILQFEKHQDKDQNSENNKDPYGNLLKWLIPLDNTISQQPRSLPPPITPSPGISSTAHKPAISSTSGSQLFSFGHFRSYSMSALPPNTAPVTGPIKTQSSKPSFDIEDWDSYSGQTVRNGQKSGTEELLSFRGVALERDRFSVRCGLEGICIPGRRWRRKLEIIQPIEINSFAADCNTDDLLCVQIKVCLCISVNLWWYCGQFISGMHPNLPFLLAECGSYPCSRYCNIHRRHNNCF